VTPGPTQVKQLNVGGAAPSGAEGATPLGLPGRRSDSRGALVDFLGAAGGAGARGRGLGAAVAVRAVVREAQRRRPLRLAAHARAPLLPAFLVLQLVLVPRRRLLPAVRVAGLAARPRGLG